MVRPLKTNAPAAVTRTRVREKPALTPVVPKLAAPAETTRPRLSATAWPLSAAAPLAAGTWRATSPRAVCPLSPNVPALAVKL